MYNENVLNKYDKKIWKNLVFMYILLMLYVFLVYIYVIMSRD